MALRPLRSIDLHRCLKSLTNYTGRINGNPCIATVLKPSYGNFMISCYFKPVKCDVKKKNFDVELLTSRVNNCLEFTR